MDREELIALFETFYYRLQSELLTAISLKCLQGLYHGRRDIYHVWQISYLYILCNLA